MACVFGHPGRTYMSTWFCYAKLGAIVSWSLKGFPMVLFDWMMHPPRSFGWAQMIHRRITLVDSVLIELVMRDLFLPRSFARSSSLWKCGVGHEWLFASSSGGSTYSSVMHAEGCLVVMELAAPTCGVAGMWSHLVTLPPVFLLSRLECAPSPSALQARVHVLA